MTSDVHALRSYLERKRREMALLSRCSSTRIDLAASASASEPIAAVIEQKFRLAAELKAEQLAKCWAITETARPPALWRNAGPFTFSFGYQRADLDVRGPPIYRALHRLCPGWRTSTVYAGSGMSAIAALLTALLQFKDTIDIIVPADCYVETRELMASLGARIRTTPLRYPRTTVSQKPSARVLWLDSSVRSSFSASLSAMSRDIDLAVFDTTCFWRESKKIGQVLECARRLEIPIALVRSHAKLDSLGIEYGRLGSVVLVVPPSSVRTSSWVSGVIAKIRETVRLFGSAPLLGHFPPFESSEDYRRCSTLRTASIIRNTRRLARTVKSNEPVDVTTFQHGLYFTIAARGLGMDEARGAAGEMAAAIGAHGLPVKHAGSFGFDFVAVEWCADAIDRSNSIRICGADLPVELADEIGQRIASWWSRHGTSRWRNDAAASARRAAA